MDTIHLLKKIISIPSYVDKKNNEKEIADFIRKNLPEEKRDNKD